MYPSEVARGDRPRGEGDRFVEGNSGSLAAALEAADLLERFDELVDPAAMAKPG